MKTGNVRLASENQFDELRICVEKAFNKLRGKINADTAQGWIGNSDALDRWAEGLIPPNSNVRGNSTILTIDRSTPFNPEKFFGKGWSIWRGPLDGNGLEGDAEEDARSLALTGVDLANIRLEHMLKSGERSIRGEEKLLRLKKTGHVRLDARLLQTLLENKHRIPKHWKEMTSGNDTRIFFDGTILRSPDGYRYALSLFWDGGWWGWHCLRLDYDRYDSNPSAVLVQ